jgi:DNA mismatch endonuclease (patch repair protein)
MSDVFTRRKRSQIMRAVRSSDTKPEMIVRRLAHRLGYRYRLHVKSLAGVPDLVFPRRRKVIFVHGCYWHRHHCAEGQSMPSSHVRYWVGKFERNRRRDARIRRSLARLGWKVLVLWECQLKNTAWVQRRIKAFLARSRKP